MTNASTLITVKPRRRGRPRAEDSGGESLRQQVLDAAAQVYAVYGYQKASVERIIATANVSRPTFYKLFSGRREVITAVVAAANERLVNRVMTAIAGKQDVPELLMAGIDAYFAWCDESGSLVGPIYSEINDADSPARRYRARTISQLIAVFHAQTAMRGEPLLDPLLYDCLLRAVEHAGSSAFWPTRLSSTDIQRHKAVARRVMLAALVSPADSHVVPSLQTVVLGDGVQK